MITCLVALSHEASSLLAESHSATIFKRKFTVFFFQTNKVTSLSILKVSNN